MVPQIVLLAFSEKECNICLALVVDAPHPNLKSRESSCSQGISQLFPAASGTAQPVQVKFSEGIPVLIFIHCW